MQEKVKVILQNKKLTQGELAKIIGVSGKTLSLWMNGKAVPRGKNVEKIEELYREAKEKEDGSKKVKIEDKKVKIQGILYKTESRRVEPDDDQGYFKNELTKERKAAYYRGKRATLLLEEENNSNIYLFPSLGGEEGEWYKIGGISALIYKYRIGPRMGRKVKILRDNDKRERFIGGISSVHYLDKFIEKMAEIGYKNYEKIDFGIIVFSLGQKFTETEIKEMREQSRREHELLQDTIKPERSFPEIYGEFLNLARILPKKVQKMETTMRGVFGERLMQGLTKIGSIYYSLANGVISTEEAKMVFSRIVDEMQAISAIMDEAGLMPEAGLLRIGTILADLREAVDKMYEKKMSTKIAKVGSEV